MASPVILAKAIGQADPALAVPAGSNRVAYVCMYSRDATDGFYKATACTLGGQAMTLIASKDPGGTGRKGLGIAVFRLLEAGIAAMSGVAIVPTWGDTNGTPDNPFYSIVYIGTAAQGTPNSTPANYSLDVSQAAWDPGDIVGIIDGRVLAFAHYGAGSTSAFDAMTQELTLVVGGSLAASAVVGSIATNNSDPIDLALSYGASSRPMLLSTFVINPTVTLVDPTISNVGPLDQEQIFNQEISVEIDGTNFEAAQGGGGVFLNTVAALNGSQVAQTVRSWAANLIKIDVSLGALPAGALQLLVTNNSGGLAALPVTVYAATGDPQIRATIPAQQIELGVPMSVDCKPYFFDSDAQQILTYSDVGASLPPGLSITAGGLVSGTLDADANTGSPYTVTLRGTDPDAQSADDTFTFTVTGFTPPGATPSANALRPRCMLPVIGLMCGARR